MVIGYMKVRKYIIYMYMSSSTKVISKLCKRNASPFHLLLVSHSGEVLLVKEDSGDNRLVLGGLVLDEAGHHSVSVDVVEEGHGLAAAEGDAGGAGGLLGRDNAVQGRAPLKNERKKEIKIK